MFNAAAGAAKSLQSCPTLCDPIDGSPPGSPVPGILQAKTLESVAISFSNAWKWKVTVKSLSHIWLLGTPWTAAYQAPPSMGFFQARVLEWVAIALSTLLSYISPIPRVSRLAGLSHLCCPSFLSHPTGCSATYSSLGHLLIALISPLTSPCVQKFSNSCTILHDFWSVVMDIIFIICFILLTWFLT